jgi:UDP-GlcNAc:undecaprenyl-phosphate GlcNAc-1-phosphate transferase
MRFIPAWTDTVPLIVAVFVLAAVSTAVLTPLVRRIASRYEVVDLPGDRRVNVAPIPRGGGLAIAGTFVAIVALVTIAGALFHIVPIPDSIGAPELSALLIGSSAAAVLGAVDDYFQLRARWQGLGQLVLAAVTVAIGVSVDFIANPFGPGVVRFADLTYGAFLGGAFSVFWILGMINSINWIDGLDGLSSGVGLIAAMTLGAISLTTAVGEPYVAVLCFTLAGSLVGFLRWNFHPASIFMGTSGTMFVGYALAVLSIIGVAKVPVAMLVLGVPIIDTFWIIVRRMGTRRSPFTPDRGHIHHRLLDLGMTHTQTVLFIYGLCIGLAILALVLSGTAQLYAFAIFVIASGLAFYALSRRGGNEPPTASERRRGAHPVTPTAKAIALDGEPDAADAPAGAAVAAAMEPDPTTASAVATEAPTPDPTPTPTGPTASSALSAPAPSAPAAAPKSAAPSVGPVSTTPPAPRVASPAAVQPDLGLVVEARRSPSEAPAASSRQVR